MVEQIVVSEDNFYIPDANKLVTENETLDNFASEKQKRLLICTLYSSLQNQIFITEANVGIYHISHIPHPNCHKGGFTEHFFYQENKNRLSYFA